jgi:molybdenum cofactor cytidylyltransferase
MSDEGFPVAEPPFEADATAAVTGVLLAAGTSGRFGGANKLLEPLGGDPIVRHAARTLVGADLADVVVVLGYEAEAVAAALADLPVRTVGNDAFREGQSTSVRRGLDAVDADAEGVVFALGDMPAVGPEAVDALVAAFSAEVGDPLVAAFEGRRGNPVLFGRRQFDALAAVEGDTGGRSVLLDADGTTLVETGDPGVTRDVDRRADLREFSG